MLQKMPRGYGSRFMRCDGLAAEAAPGLFIEEGHRDHLDYHMLRVLARLDSLVRRNPDFLGTTIWVERRGDLVRIHLRVDNEKCRDCGEPGVL